MAKVLMAWELGEGLGHVQRLLRVARLLVERGHEPVFALCNVVEPRPLFQKDRFDVFQAPYCGFQERLGEPAFLASGLADVLAVRGWGSATSLLALVEAWQCLIDYVRPRLIVVDHSPTMCLTAYQAVDVVQVGNWFPMPPVHGPTLPLLLPGQPPVMPQEALLSVVQEVQRLRGRPVPPTLTRIFSVSERFPMLFPELDPYQAQRMEPVWDPIEPFTAPEGAKVEQHFFAYLTAENPKVEAYLTEMALAGYSGTAYVRSATPALKERLRLQGLTVLDEPAPLGEMMARSQVVVHHGGSVGYSAFAAGKPQLLIPQHLEQATMAQALAQHGVALYLLRNAAPDAAGRALRQILEDPGYAERAVACALRLKARPPRPALPAVLDCCLRHLDGG